jgi:putative ABC transport system substrate-binding protein
MKRRQFTIGTLALAGLAPLASLAQQPPKVRRIAVLSPHNEQHPFKQMFVDALKKAGYSDGNLRIDWRFAEGNNDRLDALARELVALKPELIVAVAYEAILAAKQATRDIPIVMLWAWLPVDNGFIKSFARPGGNITGTSWTGLEQQGKPLETLREAAPKARRVAVAWNPAYRFSELWKGEIDRAGKRLGMTLHYFAMTTLEEVTPALEKMSILQPDALFVGGEAVTIARAKEIADFAIKRKLVAVASSPDLSTMACCCISAQTCRQVFHGPRASWIESCAAPSRPTFRQSFRRSSSFSSTRRQPGRSATRSRPR